MFRIVVVLLLASLPATADPKATAAAHYKQGKAFEGAKQYPQAIAEYEAAYKIDKLPAHLFNIAHAYHLAGDLDQAIAYYQKHLAAEPASPRAAEVRGLIATATKTRDDALAKKKSDEEAARIAAEKKRLEEEQAKKVVAATAHIKLAEAFLRAQEWSRAGDEYRAAADLDGDPIHFRAAGEAYAKGKAHDKARAAYLAYLDRAPRAADADAIRDRVAVETRAIDSAVRARVAATTVTKTTATDPPSPAPFVRGWAAWGIQAGGGAGGAVNNPLSSNESVGVDGGKTFAVALDRRYALTRFLLFRPEVALRYQDSKFGTGMMNIGAKVERAGIGLALPVVVVFGRDSGRAELLVGPCVMLSPYAKAAVPGITVEDYNRVDPGVLVGLAFGFGDFAIQVDYRQGFVSFADSFDTKMQAFTASVGVRLSRR